MMLTKFSVLFLVLMVILSIFIAKVTNIIAIIGDKRNLVKTSRINNIDKVIISDSFDNLIWFVQISDLHISVFHDQSRIVEFKEFCDKTVGAIKPIVVLASGDLTDAKNKNNIGSKQYEDEWRHYKNVLDKYKVYDKTVWLDVRGNHDNFNVPGPISKENYYRNYSIQGSENPKSYLYEIKDKNGNLYSFIALDACLEPGPRRPFNFMGILSEKEISNIKNLAKKAVLSNVTIWFGHYPTSCILSPNSEGGVRSLIGEGGTAYLCGHLHTLGGLVPNMYTLQQNGFLELELADWKDNRKYRLAAVDHDLFTFTDISHGEWPVILVTNPKAALYAVPPKEPLHRITTSTHIRILAFSLNEIAFVKIRFQNTGDWIECSCSEGSLYTLSWNPALYSRGLNNFEVHARDILGREKFIRHSFSLDETRPSFPILPRLALMLDLNCLLSLIGDDRRGKLNKSTRFFQLFFILARWPFRPLIGLHQWHNKFHILFGVAVVGCVVPLCVVRCLNNAAKVKRIIRPRLRNFITRKILYKLWILANIDVFFYSLVLYPLYIAVGPWAVGEIIEDHIGVIFVWGIFINGSYLPGSFTYAYGFAQLVIFHFPLTLSLAHHLDRRVQGISRPDNKALSCIVYFWKLFPFIIITSLQLLFTYSFWLEYGGMATVLGPIRLWSVVFALWLMYCAINIPEKTIRAAVSLLNSPPIPVVITLAEHEEETVSN